MGSPLLLVSQGPPKPLHNVFPAVGPATRLPVALSNTAKSRFTHCTNCVAPATPFVSGGAQQSAKPFVIPTLAPRKIKFGFVLKRGFEEICKAGSACGENSRGTWIRRNGL